MRERESREWEGGLSNRRERAVNEERADYIDEERRPRETRFAQSMSRKRLCMGYIYELPIYELPM